MKRYFSAILLGLLLVIIGLFIFRMLPGRRPLDGPDSRPSLAAVSASNIESPWHDDLTALGWNRYRGPNGSGTSVTEMGKAQAIPLKWDDKTNLIWKTELPGPGGSSPILTKDRLFVTYYLGYGVDQKSPGSIEDLQRGLACLDRSSGEILWTKTVVAKQPESPYRGNGLPEHGYATNTPVTDGESVFAFFGKSGVYAYDREGNSLWNRDVGDGLNERGWGSCSSLILFNDLVIVNAAEESAALIAFNKKSGEEVWRAEGKRLPFAFTTPALVRVDESRTDLVISVLGEVWGLNPVDGKLLWYCESPIGGNCSPGTIVDGKRVYCFGGYQDEGSLCVEAGGAGDVTRTHVKWTSSETSYISTPVLFESNLYWVGDDRIFYCLDAASGELVEKQRVPSSFGTGKITYASPVLIGENLFLQTRNRGVAVFKAKPDFELLAQNEFASDDSVSNATPAVDSGRLYLRTDQAVYCVGQADANGSGKETGK